jgi:DNA repair exonuclease SbcCD ATPase subunit
MEVSPYIIVQRLIIQGTVKHYVTKFEEGLNLIWGDMDTGKSSILNLIDYCLGGKNTNLMYGEMTTYGRVAFLEVDLNGTELTFERDILSESSPIKVYTCIFEKRSANFPMLMSASPDKIMPDGWVSDFILDNLGIAKVSIKESRIRDDAPSDRLSFRDLMKLLYLKQTRVGSDALLNYQSPAVFNKNVEVQKFVFNIYDDKLSGLQSELARESSDLADMDKNERFIKKFLQDVKIDTEKLAVVEGQVELHDSRLSELDDGLQSLKSNFALSTDVGLEISTAVSRMRNEIRKVESVLVEIESKYENFVKLGNTYRFDLDALQLSKLSRSVMYTDQYNDKSVPCPLCFTELSLHSPAVEDDDLEHQIKSIKNREAGIHAVLAQLRTEQKNAIDEKNSLNAALREAIRSFDENNISNISPLIASIEAIEISRTQVKLDLAEAERNSAIANKFIDIGSRIDVKTSLIAKLKRAIKTVQEGLLGLDDVIEDLTALLKKHMGRSGLQNVNDVYFDKRFTAYFRGISYYDTSSGGVRTITSIAMFITRLQYLLAKAGNLPTFLMIDTPGQNIGRHRAKEDTSEVSDPKLYENIFKQIVEVTTKAQLAGRKCQVIVVDNDMPDSLIDGKNFHLVKRFSKQGGEFDKGLINDALS